MGNKPKRGKHPGLSMTDLFLPGCPGALGAEQWFPPLDLGETDSHVVIRLEVAGVAAGDLRVTLRDDILTVNGVKREPQFTDEEKIRFICLERGRAEDAGAAVGDRPEEIRSDCWRTAS